MMRPVQRFRVILRHYLRSSASMVKKEEKISIVSKDFFEGDGSLSKMMGELKVDVYETDNEIVVRSTVAGVDIKDLDVSLHGDLLTVRGKRHIKEEVDEKDFLVRECFWGDFSRSIILPSSVDISKSEASLKKGVLTVRLPKIKVKTSIPIQNL